MSDASFDPDSVELPSGLLIGGVRTDGVGEPFTVRRPSDGKIAREEHGASGDQVDYAVSVARETYRTGGWATGEPRDRMRVMRRWADLVDSHCEELARLESVVSVRPITAVRFRDVRIAAELIRFYGENIDKIEGGVLATNANKHSLVVREPYGVVAAISPWNTPLLLATLKIAPAIAAGNAVILKPSELTPYAILRLAELGAEAGLPTGQLAILPGLGAETGSALVRHPGVDYVSFTGSAATGARVMSEAAMHGLKPVSLELGGKSPQVVFADAPDLDVVADLVTQSFCANGGQVCFAGTRLVVERAVQDELLEKIRARMGTLQLGPTWSGATTLAPIANETQAHRLERLLADAVAQGARITAGGERIENDLGGIFFQPTLVCDASVDNPAVREEFFGPVLTVQPFDDMDEALRLADHAVFGLGGGVHTRDIGKAFRAARSIQAGTVWINCFGPNTDLNAPMGGYKQSGFGKDFGLPGMDKFLKTKNIQVKYA